MFGSGKYCYDFLISFKRKIFFIDGEVHGPYEFDEGPDEVVLDYYGDSDYENWQYYPPTTTMTTTSTTTTTISSPETTTIRSYNVNKSEIDIKIKGNNGEFFKVLFMSWVVVQCDTLKKCMKWYDFT